MSRRDVLIRKLVGLSGTMDPDNAEALVNEVIQEHAAEALGKLGGAVRSPAKAAASRENGKRGGRPPGATDTQPRKRRKRKLRTEP